MLHALSTRHQQKIAWFLFFLFYANFVIAGTVGKQKQGHLAINSPVLVSKTRTAPSSPGRLSVTSDKTDLPNRQQEGKQQDSETFLQTIDVKAGMHQEEATDPGQPEMQSFKSIGTDNMVDLFTGDFSYNIPLLDVGGYPVNIFYNSGLSMDQEASWVGLGWNINPGTISRNMRGLPDDFDGSEKVIKEMNIKEDITIGANVGVSTEISGFPAGRFSLGAGLFYNNYKGFGMETSFGLSVSDKTKDIKTGGVSPTAGLNVKFNSQQGATISPSFGVTMFNSDKGTSTGLTASIGYNSRVGVQSLQLSGEMRKYDKKNGDLQMNGGLLGGSISFAHPSVTPSIQMPISRTNYNVGVSIGSEAAFLYPNTSVSGYYSVGKIANSDKTQSKPAYGFLYMDRGQKNDNALMDFNRLNEGVYTPNSPVISIPVYTYDVYSMSGEGTGGSFRPYRGDIGYVKDHYTKTKDNSFSLSGEVGLGQIFEAGVNLHAVFSPTEVGEWKTGNLARSAFQFHENDSIYQGVYFRNPAEKTIGNEAYIKALGEDDLVRIKLGGTKTAYPTAMPVLEKFGDNRLLKDTTVLNDYRTTKHQREKRSQIISYLTAEEASRIGLDKKILSYPLNAYPVGGCVSNTITPIDRFQSGANVVRKNTHISEIDVLNPDGRRYVYGLPVYNISQEETSFATNTETADAQQVADYNLGIENSTSNDAGRDNFYQKERMPAYAHSFLLTGLLSPDYVDVKGDGITEDDLGDAVKFNYTQITKADASDGGFNWRAPFTNIVTDTTGKASFNEGLKTDKKDNKASYTYGTRELWYLNSIESKNMVATFTIANRWDAKEAAGENGGVVAGTETAPGMKRLERIDLYSKADWIKYSTSAKPIKSVHFGYSYKLCQQVPSNINTATGQRGKLTLDSIWFSYNGNNKSIKNRYRFQYHNNPGYDRAANDRWGNYKPVKDAANSNVNLGGMNNTDYPFSVQNKTQADQFAAAWALDEIRLPSGGKINISYEADDYAYVQNRRAQQMFQIVGMGANKDDVPQPSLYKRIGRSSQDYFCIFIDAKRVLTTADAKRYFEGVRQLYMKLFVTMPSDMYGSGQEAIPVYAEIKDYGVSGRNNNYLYVNVLPIRESYSPMATCAIQFLRDYLPSKAFPGSDIKLANGPKSVLLALKGMMNAVTTAFSDFEGSARSNGKCQNLDVTRSFIRLNNPTYKKLGGGLRVHKVTISDSWEEMTRTNTPGMKTATYGQEYDYTTMKEVDGKVIPVSSGVATYEPGIGGEENPFREILRYSNKQPLGPTQNGATEVPVGEMFFPSPMVGYSKVTVRSINKGNVKSGVGKQVSEFYTSKDFPVLSDFTDFDNNSKVNFKSNPILQLLKLDMRQTTTLTQGFRVQLNDMNGKMKTQSSYAEDTSTLISYTANYYRLQQKSDSTYQLTNKVLAVKGSDGVIAETQVGREVEMMVDFREHSSKTITANLDLNLNVSGFFPVIVPVPSLIPPVSYEEAIYRSATLMKVVNRYGILDSVVSIDKGSQVTTKDLVYDGETGNVLLTRTNNEYNAPVYNFNYPAHWAYSGMHPAYRNIDLTYKGLTFRHGVLLNSPQVNTNYLESGDELYVLDGGESWIDDTEACAAQAAGGNACITPQKIQKSFEYRIWAIDITKDKTNLERKFIFIDRNGNPYSADNVMMRIVRSGKRNMLNESVGTVTSRFSPLITEGGQLKVKPQNSNEVINTAATTYKERWRVDNNYYVDYGPVTTVTNLTEQTDYLPIVSTHYFGVNRPKNNGRDQITNRLDYPFLEAARRSFSDKKRHSKYQNVSWGLLNIGNNLLGKYVTNATLILSPHTIDHSYPFELPDQFVHPASAPQAFSSNNGAIAIIRRMLTSWKTDPNDFSWGNYLLQGEELLINENNPNVDRTTQAVVVATPGDNTNQRKKYNVDITQMFKAMLLDKQNGSTNATGFRLHVADQNIRESKYRTAFTTTNTGDVKQGIETYVKVSYVNCSNGTVVYNQSLNTYQCTSVQNGPTCLSTFNKTLINPYVQGILGNWRTERAYTYYGDRRDKLIAPGSSVDIRSAGAIDNFKTYWNLNLDSLRTGGSAEWVWNSEITQFNKRGFEIENHDPLGRYNSGLYGYSQALPVAVANNAKHREIAFDGFEDYDYRSTSCAETCPPGKHLEMPGAKTKVSSSEAHSGKFSLLLNTGNNMVIQSVVAPDYSVALEPILNVKLDSTRYVKELVTSNGKGLYAIYYTYSSGTPPSQPSSNGTIPSSWTPREIHNGQPVSPYDTKVGIRWQRVSYSKKFIITWDGMIQPKVSGYYLFNGSFDDGMKFKWKIHNTPNWETLINDWSVGIHNNVNATYSVYMKAGNLYDVHVDYFQGPGGASISLKWKEPCSGIFTDIDPKQYYPSNAAPDTLPTQRDTSWCVKPTNIKVSGNYLTDTFSMLQGKQMVFSAWVKEPENCNNATYTHNQVTISFKGTNGSVLQSETKTFTPSGPIIEGWQRYELLFTVPSTAASCEMNLQNTGGGNVFFDDLRIHPFNANMKSFVYHPSNLRLMAELDENNYASFYEYDNDGTLVRVKKETIKGIKTINETRSALQKAVQ